MPSVEAETTKAEPEGKPDKEPDVKVETPKANEASFSKVKEERAAEEDLLTSLTSFLDNKRLKAAVQARQAKYQ